MLFGDRPVRDVREAVGEDVVSREVFVPIVFDIVKSRGAYFEVVIGYEGVGLLREIFHVTF